MNEPTTKIELLDAIEQSHQDMVRLLASMSDAEKVAPILQGGWSVLDSLAHLIAWEKMTVDWMTRSLQGEHVKRFIPGFEYETDDEHLPVMERLNQHLYEQNKDRPLDEVMRDFRATHRLIYDFVAQTDERDLFDPDRFAWRKGSPAVEMIGGNTYDHYREHQGWIMEWRARQSGYPSSKAGLMQNIRERHGEMEMLIASLTPEQLTAPELDGGWSVKDSLAHIAACEDLLVEWVGKYRRGEQVIRWSEEFPIGDGDAEEQMHKFNAHLYEKNKDRALDEVLAEFRATYGRVVATVDALSESELFNPDHFPPRGGDPLITLVAGETYEHYDEHLTSINRAFKSRAVEGKSV